MSDQPPRVERHEALDRFGKTSLRTAHDLTAALVEAGLAAEDEPVVVRDLFPAEVQVGDLVYRTAFAVVTRRRLYVWQAEGREKVLRLVAEYDPAGSTIPSSHAPPRQQATVRLVGHPDASYAYVRRQRGCGCTSSLRGWRPWRPYRVATS